MDPIGKKFTKFRRLKERRRYHEAIQILEELMDEVQASPERHGGTFRRQLYHQAAIIHRKRKDYEAEIAVLERFAKVCTGWAKLDTDLLARLRNAYESGGKIEKREVDGKEVPYHRERNIRMNEMDLLYRRAAIIDVETTGFDSDVDEIIQMGIVLVRISRAEARIEEVEDEYCGLREPSVPIHPVARKKHGLRFEDVRGHRLDDDRILDILK